MQLALRVSMIIRIGLRYPFVCGLILVALVFFNFDMGAAFAAKSPFGVALPDTTGPIATGGLWGNIQHWILARQSEFYLALKDAVKLVNDQWSALALLLGLSFAYGVFHAAGPGHGKVVLTTYLFASGATARKGAVLAFVAAMVQASVAVALIGVAAVMLNLTAMVITQTAQVLELASYSMFVLLGLWLLVRAWGASRTALASGSAGAEILHGHHHDHSHEEGCGCGHSHAPSVGEVENAKGTRGMALAVISMGLRPCSGALIVLVFALSQKVFWAGVLAAYAMGVGTGLSIAFLALFAVYARSISQTLVHKGVSGNALNWFSAIILLLAGVVVLMFGGVLLLANLL